MLLKRYLGIQGIALIIGFCAALLIAHLRITTTLLGYELGELKNKESQLLEKRARLKVELAKLTKQNNLALLASKENGKDSKEPLASR